MRARAESVSWLEVSTPAFPRELRAVTSGGVKCPGTAWAPWAFLLQWRGRAGFAPDFRWTPPAILNCVWILAAGRPGGKSELFSGRQPHSPYGVQRFRLWREA